MRSPEFDENNELKNAASTKTRGGGGSNDDDGSGIGGGGGGGSGQQDKQVDLMMFTVDWCPHCKTAKPEWDIFCEAYHGKKVHGTVINCIHYDCTNDENPEIEELLSKYKIEGFPTIKLRRENGDIIEYDAKVKYPILEQFVQTVL